MVKSSEMNVLVYWIFPTAARDVTGLVKVTIGFTWTESHYFFAGFYSRADYNAMQMQR